MIQAIRQTFKSLLHKLRDPIQNDVHHDERLEDLMQALKDYEKKFLLQERKIKTLTQALKATKPKEIE